jgi:Fe-S oxidoreductase
MNTREQSALGVLEKRLNRQITASLEACARCGICTETCHYYASDPKPDYAPAYRAEALRRIYRRYFTWTGRTFPGWVGAKALDEAAIRELSDLAYGTCTMCRRCVINCPMGIDTGLLVRTARAMCEAAGVIPEGLRATVNVHLEVGNNMGVSKEDLVDTLQWMEEQLQSETGDSNARIPIDKAGARVLYTINPREAKYYPLTILAVAKIFHAAGEDWTISTKAWDVTNYALFSGNDAQARTIAGMLADEAVGLGIEEVVMAECGHGYRAFRWEGPNWLGRPHPFSVRGFVEVVAEYLASGRIRIDPSRNTIPVTYHDPCNQARNGGIIGEPKSILRRAVADCREMTPNGRENYCCGGGGGALSMTEYAKRRISAGKIKADQIRATGAKIVATSCHNCIDQLGELNRHYKLDVQVKNLCELVADALMIG